MRRPAAFVLGGMALLLVLGRGAAAQSLGDVARQEEERRKQLKDSGKVYTNKDLSPAPPVSVPPGSSAQPAGSTAAPGGDAAPPAKPDDKPQEKKDEAYWRGRMKQLRTALDRDKTYADALQTRINSLYTDFVNRDDPAQREVIAANRQKAIDELERLKTSNAQTEKAIADLEEEARRASVPPGWLR